jgi:hypothetical protein
MPSAPPTHHQHDVTSIDGLTYCETCHVDLTDKEVSALERHERLEVLACLRENEQAIHETIRFLIKEKLLSAPATYYRGMGGEQALQKVREEIVRKRKESEEAESAAVVARRFEQRRLAERIYERMVASINVTQKPDPSQGRTLAIVRANAEAAAAVWNK